MKQWAGVILACVCACAAARGDDLYGPPAPAPVQRLEADLPLGAAPEAGAKAGEAPASATPESLGVQTIRTVMSLAAVLGLAAAGAWMAKRIARSRTGFSASLGVAGRAPSGVLAVLGRYPVGRGQQLVLLKLDRRILLLSQSSRVRGGAGGFATLSEISDPDEVASILARTEDEQGESLRARFKSLLGRFERSPDVFEGQIETQGRRIERTVEGDVAELWDVASRAGTARNVTGEDLEPATTSIAETTSGAASLRSRLDRYRAADEAAEAAPW